MTFLISHILICLLGIIFIFLEPRDIVWGVSGTGTGSNGIPGSSSKMTSIDKGSGTSACKNGETLRELSFFTGRGLSVGGPVFWGRLRGDQLFSLGQVVPTRNLNSDHFCQSNIRRQNKLKG